MKKQINTQLPEFLILCVVFVLTQVRDGLLRLSQRILGPNTLVQAAMKNILEETPQTFFEKTIEVVRVNCFQKVGLGLEESDLILHFRAAPVLHVDDCAGNGETLLRAVKPVLNPPCAGKGERHIFHLKSK